MNIFFYIVIFIIGMLFGSFYTLAVYRIPKKQDITHTHSYCPNCKHKLGFFDLIPIFSYLFLGGKCRYCKEKIRIRYLFLEVLTGFVFMAFAYLKNLQIYDLSIFKIIEFSFIILYFTFMILIAGIDKEKKGVNKGVLVYGTVISMVYMLYLWIVGQANIYRYGIYFILYILIFILNIISFKKFVNNIYRSNILWLLLIILIFTGTDVTLMSIAIALLIIGLNVIYERIKKTENKKVEERPVAFYISASNIVIMLLMLMLLI